MMDIIIAVLRFPNDPTGNMAAHQMFVADQTAEYIALYSVSSIFGKEKRVYGEESRNYVTIKLPESVENGFKVPSFIDCAKVYRVSLSGNADLGKLSGRMISESLRKRIMERIRELQADGKQLDYSISWGQFRSWNPKLK